MWDRIIFIIIDVLILVGIIFLVMKIRTISLKNKKTSKEYVKSIIIGMVSGIVVLALDKGVSKIFENWPKTEWQLIVPFLTSLFDGFILLFFEFGLVFLLVLFIIYWGILKII
jgi:hypothetical protein